MLQMLFQGQYLVFFMLIAALVMSLSFHEYGHALAAKLYGDNTAERLGRLTLNPISHIDPMGLMMVVMVGFGYAKPVPFDQRNTNSMWAQFGVAIAGPVANLIIAFVAINVYYFGIKSGWPIFEQSASRGFFEILIVVNLMLMLFNMLPIGPLDGHYILPYFLPKKIARQYTILNAQYGMYVLLGMMVLAIMDVPIFTALQKFGFALVPYLAVVD